MGNNLNQLIQAHLKGYNIIPLRGGDINSPDYKKPLIPWEKYQTQRSTITEIKEWAKKTNAFGIVTGKISNLFVVDYDSTGAFALSESHAKWSFVVPTKRGCHVYSRWVPLLDEKITTRAGIKESTDVRGEGGYVVAWDLVNLPHVNKLLPPPQWLIDLLPNKNGETKALGNEKKEAWLEEALSNLKEGNRNATLFRLASSLRSRGYTTDVCFDLLRGKAEAVGFPLDELRSVCASAGKYPAGNGHQTGAGIEEFLQTEEKVSWICQPIIAQNSIGFVAGLPQTKKTFVCMDLAVEAARGGLWLGRFKVKKSRVLFLDQERFRGETKRRFAGLLAGKNLTAKDLKDQLFIRCGTTHRINLQPSYDAFRKELNEIRPDLVIIDSFVTFTTATEKERTEIQKTLENIKQLRTEFGCAFVFVDHEGKGAFLDQKEGGEPTYQYVVGSIAKPAAAEFVLTVRRHDVDSSMVYMTKNNLASPVAPFLVKVRDLDEAKSKLSVEAF